MSERIDKDVYVMLKSEKKDSVPVITGVYSGVDAIGPFETIMEAEAFITMHPSNFFDLDEDDGVELYVTNIEIVYVDEDAIIQMVGMNVTILPDVWMKHLRSAFDITSERQHDIARIVRVIGEKLGQYAEEIAGDCHSNFLGISESIESGAAREDFTDLEWAKLFFEQTVPQAEDEIGVKVFWNYDTGRSYTLDEFEAAKMLGFTGFKDGVERLEVGEDFWYADEPGGIRIKRIL